MSKKFLFYFNEKNVKMGEDYVKSFKNESLSVT